jgi:uncharacterized membrane protein
MSNASDRRAVHTAEPLHMAGIGVAALTLLAGLVAEESSWVGSGISLIILLPVLRLATTIASEAMARRYGVAAMGILVLAFLIFSRRIS